MRLAFAGLRHGHILALYEQARRRDDVEIVAACEDHPDTRRQLTEAGKVEITHRSLRKMLAEVDCDAVAVGDYYARRGRVILAALDAGRHVIADKPICTRLDELDRIAALARRKRRCIGCQLDLRDQPAVRTARRLIADGRIGQVHTVTVLAQHPLLLASRPAWYFEPGKHGGTINDIAIHAVDGVPWLTGRRIVEITAARAWNARLRQHPRFQDAGQMLCRLDNRGSLFVDVSYLAPDVGGYALPFYWRITCHGDQGVLEITPTQRRVSVTGAGQRELSDVPVQPVADGGVFESFIREVRGERSDLSPSTADVLAASRIALLAQQAADGNGCHVPVGRRRRPHR